MNFSFFGGIFNLIIFIAIANAIYKAFIKGKSGTLDSSISKFVNQVKEEMNGGSSSSKSSGPTRPPHKVEQPKVKDDYQFTTTVQGNYNNADELFKSGLISKEEYRKLKK